MITTFKPFYYKVINTHHEILQRGRSTYKPTLMMFQR